MLERRHLAAIHAAVKNLGLSDDTYRDILHVQAGVASAKDLDLKGFEAVMKQLEALGHKRQKPQPERPDGDLISLSQQRMLGWLFGKVGMQDKARRVGFCQRQIKRNWPQTRSEANRVIEALKRMERRGYKAPQVEP